MSPILGSLAAKRREFEQSLPYFWAISFVEHFSVSTILVIALASSNHAVCFELCLDFSIKANARQYFGCMFTQFWGMASDAARCQ